MTSEPVLGGLTLTWLRSVVVGVPAEAVEGGADVALLQGLARARQGVAVPVVAGGGRHLGGWLLW